jgi:hypothetical protein
VFFQPDGGQAVIWWVTYQRGSFHLKERYVSVQRAYERCGRLINHVHFLRVIADDDIEGVASVAHCFELPSTPECEPKNPATPTRLPC